MPLHGFADAGLKGFGWRPAQLGFQFPDINGLAAGINAFFKSMGAMPNAGQLSSPRRVAILWIRPSLK